MQVDRTSCNQPSTSLTPTSKPPTSILRQFLRRPRPKLRRQLGLKTPGTHARLYSKPRVPVSFTAHCTSHAFCLFKISSNQGLRQPARFQTPGRQAQIAAQQGLRAEATWQRYVFHTRLALPFSAPGRCLAQGIVSRNRPALHLAWLQRHIARSA